MLRPVHHTLFVTEVLSWSLTLLVLASQQPQQPDLSFTRHFHIWFNGSHNTKETHNGTFASPAFPDTRFSLSTTYTYHLTHRSKHGRVKLNFSDFFLAPLENSAECGSLTGDYVKIVDGDTVMTHCGHHRPHPYISSSHELILEYHFAPPSNGYAPTTAVRLLHHSLFRVGYQFLSRADGMVEWDNLIRGYHGK